MESSDPDKKYGLFKFYKPNNTQTKSKITTTKPSVFGNDDDDDDSDQESSSIPPQYQSNSNLKRQIKNKLNEAMELDPTIFQYDEVYDEIKSKTNKSNQLPTNIERKPKYINNLLKAAETRKLEQEIRMERKIHKEREKEGDEFKDKESFVTASYREKLEEMKKTQEELDKKDQQNTNVNLNIMSHITGSLFNKNDNETQDDNTNADNGKEKIIFNKSNTRKKITIRETVDDDENDDDGEEDETEEKSDKNDKMTTNPQDETEPPAEPKTNQTQESKDSNDQTKIPLEDNKNETTTNPNKSKELESNNPPSTKKSTKELEAEQKKKEKEKKLKRAEIIEKLFTKRTVGKIFEEAQKRYFERKQLRGK